MKIGVTGHQNIPGTAIPYIRDNIKAYLNQNVQPNLVCLTSLAVGADQLVAEIVLEHNGELQVILPSELYSRTFESLDDEKRFNDLRKRARIVEVLDFPAPSEEAFLAAGQTIVDRCDVLIAIWDGQPSRGKGGTADIVEYALKCGREINVIWPERVSR